LQEHYIIKDLSRLLTAKEDQLLDRVLKLQNQIKEKEREIENLRKKLALSNINENLNIIEKEGFKVAYVSVENLNPNELREIADHLRQKLGKSIILVASKDTEKQKVNFVVAVSKELTENYKADDILKKVASAANGSGGGRPDFAQGGINDTSKLGQLFEEFKKIFS